MRARRESGAAVVDIVLVMAVLIPIVLGIVQLSLVLFVRNTLSAAASEGARYAATQDQGPAQGAAKTWEQISQALAGRFARDVTARQSYVGGAAGVEVTVRATVPALGLGGPGVELVVRESTAPAQNR